MNVKNKRVIDQRGLAFPKPVTIVDKPLLRKYTTMPCAKCGRFGTPSNPVHAHHWVPRGKQRLDIPENLTPFHDCTCHHDIEKDPVKYFLLYKTEEEREVVRALAPRDLIFRQMEDALGKS